MKRLLGALVALFLASGWARAYIDAARRLAGEVVEMTVPTGKQRLFAGLFGRRAA